MKLITIRSRQVTQFKETTESLKAFIQFCSIFKQHIDTSEYDKKLKNIYKTNINNLTLSQVYKCLSYSNLDSSLHLIPEVTYFDEIDNETIKVINKINTLVRLKCVIFDQFFTESCLEIKQQHGLDLLPVSLVAKKVFQRTIDKWKMVSDIIESGKKI